MPLGPDEIPFPGGFLHEQNSQSKEVRPLIQKSWQRCWPRLYIEQEPAIEPEELAQTVEMSSNLLSAAQPVTAEVCKFVQGQNVAFVLVNQFGSIISLQGDSTILENLGERGIGLGADLSEVGAGTNAFGLALNEYTPVEVRGNEHFLRKFQGLYGAAAPIFDPSSRLLGAAGIFGFLDDLQPLSLALANLSANAIMGHYKVHELKEEKMIELDRFDAILSRMKDGVIAWNENGLITYLNPAAETVLGVQKKKLLDRTIQEVVQIPTEVWEAFQANQEVHTVEASLSVDRRQVACLLSLYPLSGGQGTLAFLRPAGDLHQLITREVSSKGNFSLEDVLGVSPQIRRVRRQVQSAARARASVLVSGELGTGKSLLSQIIHSLSDYREGPFIVFQCASLPCELILPELLGSGAGSVKGHQRQVSKFELADGGVLYFQDIDLLPLEAQVVLLNFMKTGIVQVPGSSRKNEVQTRIIAAASCSLEKLAAEGKFIPELLRWLKVFSIEIPPLRERKEDIPILAEHIIDRFSCRNRSDIDLAPEALALMVEYDWPGNIRELELILERAVYSLGSGSTITSAQLPLSMLKQPAVLEDCAREERVQPLDRLQQEALIQAAQDCRGNITEMARALGIGRTTVWRWLKRMNISLENYRC